MASTNRPRSHEAGIRRRLHPRLPPAMTADADPLLQAAIAALAPPGVLIGHRLIAPGDEVRPPAAGAARVRRQRRQGATGQRRSPPRRARPARTPGTSGRRIAEIILRRTTLARRHRRLACARRPRGDRRGRKTAGHGRARDRHRASRAAAGTTFWNWSPHRRNARIWSTIPSAAGCILSSRKRSTRPSIRSMVSFSNITTCRSTSRVEAATVRGGRTIDFRYCVASHLVALAFVPAA